MVTSLITLLVAAGPRPTLGPALPLAFLKQTAETRTVIGTYWKAGCFDVRFQYRSPKSVRELAAQLDKEPMLENAQTGATDTQYSRRRVGLGVAQDITLSRPVTYYSGHNAKGDYSGQKQASYTTITVSEILAGDSAPAAWYRGAISPKPPVPLIEIPFLPGVRTSEVGLTSFEGLMSSKGIMYTGTDAAVFGATVLRPLGDVEGLLAIWAKANGYRKTMFGSYFKPKVKLFEIELNQRGPKECTVRLYTSDREALNPYAREKF